MRAVNIYATRTALTEWAGPGQNFVNKVDGVSLDPRLESFGANTRLAIDVQRLGSYLTTIYAYGTTAIRNADTGRDVNVGSIVYGETNGPLAFWSGSAWTVDAFTVATALRAALSAFASSLIIADGVPIPGPPGTTSFGDMTGDVGVVPFTPTGKSATNVGALLNIAAVALRGCRPTDFGALSSDDTSLFNQLNEFLAANPLITVVDLGSATYNLPRGWQLLRSNLNIMGIGAIIDHAMDEYDYLAGLGGHGISDIRVSGLTVRTALGKKRDESVMSIYFYDAEDITVYGCKTYGGQTGIWLNGVQRGLVERCIVDTPIADGIHFSHAAKHCTAKYNMVIGAGDDSLASGSYVDTAIPANAALRCENIKFIDNVIRDNIVGAGFSDYGTTYLEVSGNLFNNIQWNFLEVSQYIDTVRSKHVRITNNICIKGAQATTIRVSYWDQTPEVDDPPADASMGAPLVLTHVEDCVVSGNYFEDCGKTSPLPASTIISDTKNLTIAGNTWRDVFGIGLTANLNNENFVVEGNRFYDCPGIPIDLVQYTGVSGISCTGVHNGYEGDHPWHDGKSLLFRIAFWTNYWPVLMRRQLSRATGFSIS